MPRRPAYTELKKTNRVTPAVGPGLGDVAFKGFQCPTVGCTNWLFVRSSELMGEYSFSCPFCRATYGSGDSVKLFDYDLVETVTGNQVQTGEFDILIDEYVRNADEFKYCILCFKLKSLNAFSAHSRRKTGRQGECRQCKTPYNSIKNQTRLQDQHREASQKRRLLVDLGGTTHFNSQKVRDRFGDRCFKCGKDVSTDGAAQFDHTLPIRFLWPMTTDNATLLCAEHNGQKGAIWPGEFYSDPELRRLALLTGLDFDLLSGPPRINPDALELLRDGTFVDSLFEKYAHYVPDLIKIRNRVLSIAAVDFFASSSNISITWIRQADAALQSDLTPAGE
ncbi:hypothetical protein [Microbacterium aurantiacum]|uniref:hypothetical protein n=1 Tax=Microbacterium aurantiacum TaxID=162393 RepID=UPI00341F2D26